MEKNKLFIPGPINISEHLKNITYFRDNEFTEMILENEELLKKAVNCESGRVIPLTCSGTGGMDAIVTNLISNNDKVLVIDGGTFGKRWYEICKFYGRNVVKYSVPFGKDINFVKFREQIEKIQPTIVLIQHHETSSGQLYDIKKIGKIAKDHNSLFVVDAICSFLSDSFKMDSSNVDVALISSQKGLLLDSGMSYIILNNKSMEHLLKIKQLSYYFNLNNYLRHHNLGRGHTPFTPAVGLVYALHNRLVDIDIEQEIKKVSQKAQFFRSKIVEFPLRMIPETPSNFLTALIIDNKDNGAKDLTFQLKKKNIFICPTNNVEEYLPNSSDIYFRVAHTGCDKSEHEELIDEMRKFFR